MVNAHLARAFSEALARDPTLESKLAARRVPTGTIRMLRKGEYSDRVILAFVSTLKELLGIDAQQIIFDDAKLTLWGKEDPLPDITTTKQLLAAVSAITKSYGVDRTMRSFGVGNRFAEWKRGERIALKSMQFLLAGILTYRTGGFQEQYAKTAAKPPQPSRPEKAKPVTVAGNAESHSTDADARVQLSALLSALHSIVTALERVTKPTDFVDGDRARLMNIWQRLALAAGITQEALEAMYSMNEIEPSELAILLRLAGKKGGGKS